MPIIGVDIGGTKCTVTLAGGDGRPAASRRIATGPPDPTLENIAHAVAELLTPAADDDLPIFGVACGGPLDAAAGLILSPPNLPGWDRIAVLSFLHQKFGGRGYLMNDANAGALAEWRFGAGRGKRNLVFLTLGTGLGGGIICDGRLIEGADGNAGEIGHVRLSEEGPIGYGKRGSAEGWCSGGGIARRVADGIETGELPADWPHRDAKAVVEAARGGDSHASRIIAEAGRRLGQTLAMLIDVLNPERIVLGSLFVRAADLIAGPLRDGLAAEALPASLAACEITAAELGEDLPQYQGIAVAEYWLDLEQNTASRGRHPPGLHFNARAAERSLADTDARPNLPESLLADTRSAVHLLAECVAGGGKILLCGNGGSAADAEHFAGELLKRFETPRPRPPLTGLDPALIARLEQAIPAIPLTGFTSLRTAVANDTDPAVDYAQLVSALGRPGDALVAISTSGDSANVCLAAEVARSMGMRVLALTGGGGGRLAGLADGCISAPGRSVAHIQELHLPVYHAISRALEAGFFGAGEASPSEPF